MQSGNALSSARLFLDTRPVTKVDIYPDSKASAAVESADASAGKGTSSDFFGADGIGFRDVLDAINPLNHIPIVSDLMKEATGHQVSTASRLVGGTLLGGPIGFVTALASVIFEGSTGSSPAEAAYAALSGENTTEVAANAAAAKTAENETSAETTEEVAQAASTKPVEMASLIPASAAVSIAAPVEAVAASSIAAGGADKAVLDLYGNSPASAHNSYRKAQMLPYLRDVTTSKVL